MQETWVRSLGWKDLLEKGMATHSSIFTWSKIMASGPITSWEINGETVETVSDFTFGGSKITADGDCSQGVSQGDAYSLEEKL